MSDAQVSVLIPCYNAEKYIGETLDSVFCQTWKNFEVVVVDDGSTDNSVAETRKFLRPQLTLIEQANAGAGAARNTAFRHSRGDFIQFLDADDLLSPDKIEMQMRRIKAKPGAVASCSWGRFFDDPATTVFASEDANRDLKPLDWLALSRSNGGGMLFPALWLIPRHVCETAGPWNPHLSLGDDGEYFTRIILAADEILFCREARCHYRSGLPESLSGRKSRLAFESQFEVNALCERHVRVREDSDRVKRGFALTWQHLAHSCYPYAPDIAERALVRARSLHSVSITPSGGVVFSMLSRLVGWRTARRLQVLSGRP